MLTESEARVLSVLATDPNHALTARDIAAYAGITPPTVRGTAKWLAYAGLVQQVQEYPAAWRITGPGRRSLTPAHTDLPTKTWKGNPATVFPHDPAAGTACCSKAADGRSFNEVV